MTDFPTFNILQLMKSLPFHIREGWSRYPFGAESLHKNQYTVYPTPRGLQSKKKISVNLRQYNNFLMINYTGCIRFFTEAQRLTSS